MIPRPVKFLSPKVRNSLIVLSALGLFALLTAACSIPFVFESQTIRYKFGLDKTLLRIGQVLGMTAGTLLLLQMVLSARLKILDQIFGLSMLYIFHRANAVLISGLALLHPLFVFTPEDVSTIPLEIKYWPEGLGILLLLTIWLLTVTGLWRQFLSLPFERWWFTHRFITFSAVIMLIIHVLNVSESFASGLPRQAVFIVGGMYLFLWGWVKIKPYLLQRKPYLISDISLVGRDAYKVTLILHPQSHFSHLPGQFAFLTVRSRNLSAEEHPFTISSTPTRPESISFIIRCSGDWTSHVGQLLHGDTAVIDGPYGRFSHLVCDPDQELIMIAGGIGITPILSMLRYMADTNDPRKIILIWSNRTPADIVFGDELVELTCRLPGLRIEHVFTRKSEEEETFGRLDRNKLSLFLQNSSRQAAIFICGPPQMMKSIRKILSGLRFKRRRIYSEDFSL